MPIKRRARGKKSEPVVTKPVEETVEVAESTEPTTEIVEQVETEQVEETPAETIVENVIENTETIEIESKNDEIIEEIQEVVVVEEEETSNTKKNRNRRPDAVRHFTIQNDDDSLFKKFSKNFTDANMNLHNNIKRGKKARFDKIIEKELAGKRNTLAEIPEEEKKNYKFYKTKYINQTIARNQSDLILYQLVENKNNKINKISKREIYCNSIIMSRHSEKFKHELAKYRADKGPNAKYYIKCKMSSDIIGKHLFKVLEAMHTGRLTYSTKMFESLWKIKHYLKLHYIFESAFQMMAIKLGYNIYKTAGDKEKNISLNEKIEKEHFRRLKGFVKKEGQEKFIERFGSERFNIFKGLAARFDTETTLEKVTEEETEAVTENATEEVTEEATEDVIEEVVEVETEQDVEQAVEETTEDATEEPTEVETEEIVEVVTEEITEDATGEQDSVVEIQEITEEKFIIKADLTKAGNNMGTIKIIDEDDEKPKVVETKKVVLPVAKATTPAKQNNKINSNKSAIQVTNSVQNKKSPNKRAAVNRGNDGPRSKIRRSNPNFQQNNRKTMPMPNFKRNPAPIYKPTPQPNYGMQMYGMPMNTMQTSVPHQNMGMMQPQMYGMNNGMQPMMMNQPMRPVMMQNNQPYYGNGN